MDFLCILQTHTLSNNQDYTGLTRYASPDKAEVTKRCVRSLIASMNYASFILPHLNFKLVVLDDHSDEQSVATLKDTLSRAKIDTELYHLETHGIMPSILACYEYGHAKGKDMVYFAQDDYLYTESAIYEMIDTFILTSAKLEQWSSIYPFDDPWRYTPENIVPVQVILGKRRHWRRNYKVASCFLTHHEVITKQWDLFEAMGKHPVDYVMEDETINRLFSERGYMLFTPIPSLALHLQFDNQKDPYIDWKSWWDLHGDTL